MSSLFDGSSQAGGPPWILGWRGAPLDEPENTLVSFRRALALGLDGLAWEVQATRGDELVVLADATLERTTNGAGRVAEQSLVDLSDLDAGGWQAAERAGERVPLPHEVLSLREPGAEAPLHVVFVDDVRTANLLPEVLARYAYQLSVRVAARSIEVCRTARDAGAQVLWVLDAPSERLAAIAQEEGFAAVGARPADWRAAPPVEWRAERWWLGCDTPEDLLAALQAQAFGLLTHEGPRARSARAWQRLAPGHSWPVSVAEASMPLVLPRLGPAWSARHEVVAHLSNPLDRPMRARALIQVRRGAFEVTPEVQHIELEPQSTQALTWHLQGGSWRVGGDPLLAVRLEWLRAGGQTIEWLCDTPITRRRTLTLDVSPVRVQLVRESPRDREAYMVVRLHRGHVYASIEDSGGIPEAHAVLRLGERTVVGGRGVRLPLPSDARIHSPAFSCGFLSHRRGERYVRRFCGGLLDEPDAGAPGLLHIAATA